LIEGWFFLDSPYCSHLQRFLMVIFDFVKTK